ncbi:MAG: SCO family protein [Gemmatimonadota bacterium]
MTATRSPHPPGTTARGSARAALLLGVAATGAIWLSGCRAESPEARAADLRARETGYRGILLPEPPPRPEFTLTDTRGRPFDFVAETDDDLTLLFFGYTYCPDVCPVHMASLGAVLADFPYALRSRIEVVFVTTDPERDTPERLRSWLDNFDPGFIGLRGPMEEVNRIQVALGLPAAVRQETDDGVLIGHASQVIAFAPHDRVRVLYPFGTRQADWRHDLPRLVEAGGAP